MAAFYTESDYENALIELFESNLGYEYVCGYNVTANQTSGQKNEPRSTSAQIPYSVHHNELQ